jgi:hypothetical protein
MPSLNHWKRPLRGGRFLACLGQMFLCFVDADTLVEEGFRNRMAVDELAVTS